MSAKPTVSEKTTVSETRRPEKTSFRYLQIAVLVLALVASVAFTSVVFGARSCEIDVPWDGAFYFCTHGPLCPSPYYCGGGKLCARFCSLIDGCVVACGGYECVYECIYVPQWDPATW